MLCSKGLGESFSMDVEAPTPTRVVFCIGVPGVEYDYIMYGAYETEIHARYPHTVIFTTSNKKTVQWTRGQVWIPQDVPRLCISKDFDAIANAVTEIDSLVSSACPLDGGVRMGQHNGIEWCFARCGLHEEWVLWRDESKTNHLYAGEISVGLIDQIKTKRARFVFVRRPEDMQGVDTRKVVLVHWPLPRKWEIRRPSWIPESCDRLFISMDNDWSLHSLHEIQNICRAIEHFCMIEKQGTLDEREHKIPYARCLESEPSTKRRVCRMGRELFSFIESGPLNHGIRWKFTKGRSTPPSKEKVAATV